MRKGRPEVSDLRSVPCSICPAGISRAARPGASGWLDVLILPDRDLPAGPVSFLVGQLDRHFEDAVAVDGFDVLLIGASREAQVAAEGPVMELAVVLAGDLFPSLGPDG